MTRLKLRRKWSYDNFRRRKFVPARGDNGFVREGPQVGAHINGRSVKKFPDGSADPKSVAGPNPS